MRARRPGVELLRHRDERDAVLVERLHDVGKVEQRSAEPADLVQTDAVDLASGDLLQQSNQRGPLGVATGETAVIVLLLDDDPPLLLLAGDVGLRRVALGDGRLIAAGTVMVAI